jgi:hypothetical protein
VNGDDEAVEFALLGRQLLAAGVGQCVIARADPTSPATVQVRHSFPSNSDGSIGGRRDGVKWRAIELSRTVHGLGRVSLRVFPVTIHTIQENVAVRSALSDTQVARTKYARRQSQRSDALFATIAVFDRD